MVISAITEETKDEKTKMPRLWRHLLADNLIRSGLLIAGFLVISVLTILYLHFFDEDFFGDVSSGFIVALFGFMLGELFASDQYGSYRLLTVLPLSARTRGRLVWFHHVAAMPVVYFAVAVVFLELVSPLTGWLLGPLHFFVVACAMVPPSMALLVWRRPPPMYGLFLFYLLFFVLAILVAFAFVIIFVFNDEDVPGLFLAALAAAAIFVVALSYARASKISLSPRPAAAKLSLRLPLPSRLSGPGPLSRHPLARLVLLGSLKFASLALLVLLVFFPEWLEDEWKPFAASAGVIVMLGFSNGARSIWQRACLMRALPLTAATTATVTLAHGLTAAVYFAGAAFLLSAAWVEGALAIMVNGLLLGVCLGAFGAGLSVWFGNYSALVILYFLSGVAVIVSNLQFPWITHPFLTPIFAAAAPACLAAGWFLMRNALRNRTVYDYQQPPLTAEAEW